MRLLRGLSFQTKLVLSFAAVIVLTTLLGYTLINRSIDRAFEAFAIRNLTAQDQLILPLLARYVQRTGTAAGFAEFFGQEKDRVPYMLIDSERRVVFAPDETLEGRRVSQDQVDEGLRIVSENGAVWTLLPVTLTPWTGSQEQLFLRSVNNALWIAGWVVGAVGLLLAFTLLRQLAGPLKRLNQATQRVAKGELGARVPATRSDELGHLAKSFNRMAESLEQAEAAKQQMIADISHELRTPISVIRGVLEAMRDGVIEPTEENFAALHNKIMLTTRLVDDLQQLALADAGHLSIVRSACDVSQLLERILTTIGVQFEDAGIGLGLEISEDLPPIDVDPQRIEQVVLNLLSNAMRHAPEGSVRIAATLHGENTLRISVCDDGPGIDPEELSHVFDRFYRADSARSRETGGSGLGLAIAKALIEAHGGRISAENAEPHGARFHVDLPIRTSS